MELKSVVALDGNGNALPGAKTYVYLQGTNTLASIFGPTFQPLSNPMTTDANAVATFTAADGAYDIQFETNNLKGPKFSIQLVTQSELARASIINGVSRFSELRAKKPDYEGQRVYLRSHTPSTLAVFVQQGGGWFTGRMVAQTDDGGYIASSGDNWHWKRDIDIEELDVTHFGAVSDAITDASGACEKMFDFLNGSYANSVNPRASTSPIKFPAGTFLVAPLDLSAKGVVTSAAALKLARQRVAWRLNGLKGTGIAAAGGNAATPDKVDLDYVKANKPELYMDWSVQENHNGRNPVGFFGLVGPSVDYGKAAQTTIISTKENDTYVFDVKAGLVVIHGIRFNGQNPDRRNWTTGYGPAPGAAPDNTQGFFHNWKSEAQYVNVTCCHADSVGGFMFDIMDSLDCEFSQIYSSLCWGDIIRAGWSNAVNGNWDHGTALKLADCNFQWHQGITPLRLVKIGQCQISNVWIEHSLCPADLHDCQATVDTLCVESSAYSVQAYGSRIVMTQFSNPTGVQFDVTTKPYLDNGSNNPDWHSYYEQPDKSQFAAWNKYYPVPQGSKIEIKNSAYENGFVRIENFGMEIDGSVKPGWIAGHSIRNPTDAEAWVLVGLLEMQQNEVNYTFTQIAADLAAWIQARNDAVAADPSGATKPYTDAEIATKKGQLRTAFEKDKNLMSQFQIEILGSRFIDSGTTDSQSIKLPKQLSGVNEDKSALANGNPGKTLINIMHLKTANSTSTNSSGQTSVWHENDSCVLEVVTTSWHSVPQIWVRLAPRTFAASVFIHGNGVSRFQAGSCSRFVFNGFRQAMKPGAAGSITVDGGVQPVVNKWAIHTDKAGLGLNHDGSITLKTIAPPRLPAAITLADVGAWTTVVGPDGVQYAMPLFKIPTA
ncbi:structural protein containing EPS-depolymerase domain [Pantoea phage vB_PagS_Vid5]|uniref:Tail spike protein n=1 Tax=Pantoea phage vB_PagS_Vid5 TaxID=2099652 RepID=A0A2P1CL82_9CAUD|nr:EPS depolymerase [Pantoea phage vB_PagS_Vid5]AVJ51765.1 structural protein containing EPS-depolymerase domain [Pantoea phage vB_PagS_Vid5]